mmetsp:Transcript_68295/g.193469  ORF Transcript_68295/g.193469 Transcript_68295/m.193469 type:complete len:228 (-) Transcript_68295:37-720(-)
MLQVYKNGVVTEALIQQAEVRQRELEFFTNNLWIWGGTSTVMAGFVFAQLTNPVPEATNIYLEISYLVFTAVCLGLDLCVITWSILCCIWGPGMALRGPEGMKSFHATVEFLRGEQQQIYVAFVVSVLAYFLSSCCLVWVYPSRSLVNAACMGVLFIFLVVIIILQIRLEMRIGGSIFSHDGADGRIKSFAPVEEVADLDDYVAATVPPDSTTTATRPGMYPTSSAF